MEEEILQQISALSPRFGAMTGHQESLVGNEAM